MSIYSVEAHALILVRYYDGSRPAAIEAMQKCLERKKTGTNLTLTSKEKEHHKAVIEFLRSLK